MQSDGGTSLRERFQSIFWKCNPCISSRLTHVPPLAHGFDTSSLNSLTSLTPSGYTATIQNITGTMAPCNYRHGKTSSERLTVNLVSLPGKYRNPASTCLNSTNLALPRLDHLKISNTGSTPSKRREPPERDSSGNGVASRFQPALPLPNPQLNGAG
jgi:hypothetical protein